MYADLSLETPHVFQMRVLGQGEYKCKDCQSGVRAWSRRSEKVGQRHKDDVGQNESPQSQSFCSRMTWSYCCGTADTKNCQKAQIFRFLLFTLIYMYFTTFSMLLEGKLEYSSGPNIYIFFQQLFQFLFHRLISLFIISLILKICIAFPSLSFL